eukprot:352392-Pelagomonas_calceolata.AAC.2
MHNRAITCRRQQSKAKQRHDLQEARPSKAATQFLLCSVLCLCQCSGTGPPADTKNERKAERTAAQGHGTLSFICDGSVLGKRRQKHQESFSWAKQWQAPRDMDPGQSNKPDSSICSQELHLIECLSTFQLRTCLGFGFEGQPHREACPGRAKLKESQLPQRGCCILSFGAQP